MRTVDISGMDESRSRFGYEWGCQVIMCRALHWLRQRPKDSQVPLIRSFKNITGLTVPANRVAEEMTNFALDHEKLREFGATGAMVQYGIAHALKRFELGDAAYFKEFSDDPGRVYEFDEHDAFDGEPGHESDRA